MPNLREEITRTFTRITGRGDAHAHKPLDAPDPREGRQYGAYRIIRRLGSGGMGQVYLALDTRLGRHAALKFLSPDLITDEASLLRLVQEARAASSLNHPNILTIFDVAEIDGEHFIVSEFVEGVTLRTAMERGVVNDQLTLEIAIQIASALSAAHAAGVIHRDLKPSNVMLRPDGYLKVIDFGLAKLLRPENDPSRADLTRPGAALGTAEYMSPEQARGEHVDHRTDIWSLGVILYELVAGHLPFEGPTLSHVLVAIQDQPVPALPANKPIPLEVREVIVRALEKRPKDRYASTGDMLRALQAAVGSTPSAKRTPIPLPNRKFQTTRLASICGGLVIILAAVMFSWWALRQPKWLQLTPIRQLTFNGRVQLDAISPDGKYLAYTIGQADGQQALYLKQINSPGDELKIPPRKINYQGLTFSPDNQTLYVVEKDEAFMGRLYAVPILGAPPATPVVVNVDGPVAFSPEGDQFVYVQYKEIKSDSGSSTLSRLILAKRDGQTERDLLATTDVFIFRQPAWSPDGKRIAVFLLQQRPQGPAEAFLDLVKLDGSEERRPLPDWQKIGQPQWTADGKSLIVGGVVTYSEPDRRYQLHQLSVTTGVDHLLTNDLAAYNKVGVSADGKSITALKADSKAVVWISKPNDFRHGTTATAEAELDPTLAWADAAHVLVDSRRNGYPNLGLLDPETQSFIPLTNEHFVEQGAALVPGTNGKSVVFASNRSGRFHIWRFDSDSNRMRQLTFGPNYDERPSVSADSKWVVYTSWSQNVPHLMRVSASGGSSTQVGNYAATDPQISPDSKWIACYLQEPSSKKWIVAIIPFDGVGATKPIPSASTPFRWSADGASITTIRTDSKGVSNVWRIPLSGSADVELTDFEDDSIPVFSWSAGGDRLACLRTTGGADVALFKANK